MDLISVSRESGLEFKVRVRGHEFRADMSVADGGRDAAPSPAELLAGSLGACVAMMVQSYCDTHGYTDGDVEVSMTVELADDPRRVGAVIIDVELPRNFPEEKKDVAMRVAERCTIHKTLEHCPRVDIEIT